MSTATTHDADHTSGHGTDPSGVTGHAKGGLGMLALGALGVVYGDIGTSPLYAFRETFEGHGHELHVNEASVLGVLSIVFWVLIIVISIKYLMFVMRASVDGEGGILALTSLAQGDEQDLSPHSNTRRKRLKWLLIAAGLFGTALLYGDGVITPAISVLSAVEGTEVVAPGFTRFVLPVSIIILIGLFAVQVKGTGTIGKVFGPIMIVWFTTIGVLGAISLSKDLSVLSAINPIHAVRFFQNNGFEAFKSLGAIFLVVTGGEALYADMGHFGRKPISVGWFGVVFPALLLCYFGQGALLLNDPKAISNPFFNLAPDALVIPLVILATVATVIASQALISGAFSLTMQAVQMGLMPRVLIKHTSRTEYGQIYIPAINWALMISCIALVAGFRTSSALASAYGLAVTATMAITTVLFYVVAVKRFGWNKFAVAALCTLFMVIDLAFLGANVLKIPSGGWFPLLVAGVIFTLMTTWKTGRRLVAERTARAQVPLQTFLDEAVAGGVNRVPGTAVFLFSTPGAAPPAMIANARHYGVLHERMVIITILTSRHARVEPSERCEVTNLGHGVDQLLISYGFLEQPDIVTALGEGQAAALQVDPETATFFLGAENLRATSAPGMANWRERLFLWMHRNATKAANYFGLPTNRTIEIGVQVDL